MKSHLHNVVVGVPGSACSRVSPVGWGWNGCRPTSWSSTIISQLTLSTSPSLQLSTPPLPTPPRGGCPLSSALLSCYRDREWLEEDTLEKRRKEIVFIIKLRYPKICFMHWFCVLDLKIIHIKDEGQAFFPVCQKGSSPTCLASEFCSWLVCKFCLLLLLSVQWLIFRLLAS